MFRFSHLRIPGGEMSAPIQPNPQLKTLRQTRIMLLICIALLLVAMVLFQLWMFQLNVLYPRVPPSSAAASFGWFLTLPALLTMSIGLLINLRQGSYWRRIEALRFATLAEGRQLLADEQPTPDVEALALPAMIATRAAARSTLISLLIFAVFLGSYLVFSIPQTPSIMICSNPLLGSLKMMRIMYLGVVALIVIEILVSETYFSLSGPTSRPGLSGFFIDLWSEFFARSFPALLLWLGSALIIFFSERYWKRVERLRFSAASGNEHLRAPNQLQPDAEALQLPMTITLRMTRRFALFMGLAFFVGMALFLLLMEVVNPIGGTFFLAWPMNIIFLALLVGLSGGIYLLCSGRRTRIEVSESGIRVYQSKRVSTSIPWQEARLFACYGSLLTRHTGAELTYELSSGSHMVRWSSVQNTNSPWLMWAATVPLAEYRAHIQALVALISARTGLPLYDLRRTP